MTKTIATRSFVSGIVVMGAAALVSSLAGLSIAEPVKFVCYCTLALVAATMRVRLPGITGTLTVNYVVVLIGLADLSLPECLLAGALATVVQCFVHTKGRPQSIRVLFNVASIAIAIFASGFIFSSPYLVSHGIGLLMRLTFAAITYFVFNTAAVAAIVSLTESRSFLQVWLSSCLWVFPFFFMGAGLARLFHWVAVRWGWQAAMLAAPGIYILYATYHYYLGRLQKEKEYAQDIAGLHLRTIEALALAIDAKDQTTPDHLQRVRVYATEIARELALSGLEMDALEAAAMLHDIGKLAVPEHIVSKPGKLTPEEFEKMKIHPSVGAEILERVQFPYPVADIVRSHHEKWDGSGYPNGLKGEEIPLGARILSVVDCLHAVVAERQYRKGVPLEQAIDIVSEQAGKAFDPTVVEILRRRYPELETMALKESGRIAASLKAARSGDHEVDRLARKTGASGDAKPGFLTSIAAARQEVQTLFELSDDLGQSLCQSNKLAIFASKLKVMIPHDLLCIYTVLEDAVIPDYVEGAEQLLFSSLRIPLGQGLSGWAAENNSSVVNGNPAVEPGYLNNSAVITNLKSAITIPLEEDGNVIGVVSLYSRQKSAFSRDHLRVLQALAPRLAAMLGHGRRLSEAQGHAVTDYLTSLPNSRSLYLHLDAEMARCRRRHASVGVFLCDLDGFKRINDEHGHLEGNRVLKAVATSLKECCRGYDYVARMGGDEFVVLLPDIEQASLDDHVRRLRDAVESTGISVGHAGLSASIGAVAFIRGGGYPDADAILAEADRRMYADKRGVKATARVVREPYTRTREAPVRDCLELLAFEGSGGAGMENAPAVVIH